MAVLPARLFAQVHRDRRLPIDEDHPAGVFTDGFSVRPGLLATHQVALRIPNSLNASPMNLHVTLAGGVLRVEHGRSQFLQQETHFGLRRRIDGRRTDMRSGTLTVTTGNFLPSYSFCQPRDEVPCFSTLATRVSACLDQLPRRPAISVDMLAIEPPSAGPCTTLTVHTTGLGADYLRDDRGLSVHDEYATGDQYLAPVRMADLGRGVGVTVPDKPSSCSPSNFSSSARSTVIRFGLADSWTLIRLATSDRDRGSPRLSTQSRTTATLIPRRH